MYSSLYVREFDHEQLIMANWADLWWITFIYNVKDDLSFILNTKLCNICAFYTNLPNNTNLLMYR